jgi:hypothetical protein
MDISVLIVFGGALLMSGYLYVTFLLLLNDSISDMPPWVPFAWPLILPPVYAWILVSRWTGRPT